MAKFTNIQKLVILASMPNAPKCIICTRYCKPHVLKGEVLIPIQCNKFHADPIANASRYKPPDLADEQVDLNNTIKISDEI